MKCACTVRNHLAIAMMYASAGGVWSSIAGHEVFMVGFSWLILVPTGLAILFFCGAVNRYVKVERHLDK